MPIIEDILSQWSWLTVLGVQGVYLRLVAEFLYEQGDTYAKSVDSQFTSNNRIFVRIGMMAVIAGVPTGVIPSLLHSNTEYLIPRQQEKFSHWVPC